METKLDELKRISKELLEEIAKLEAPKKFKFKYEEWKTYMLNISLIDDSCEGSNQAFSEYGRYRRTEESAKDALELNKRVNRLHAAVEQIQGNVGGIYYVVKRSIMGTWDIRYDSSQINPCQVYMSQDTALEIRRLLNSGELEL